MTAINRRLNIVIPINRSDDTVLYVHSTPIMTETFEFYHMVLAKTWSGFVQNGLDPRSAPSVAALILKETAKNTIRSAGYSWADGPDGVGGESGLIAEMLRLTNVVVPDKNQGWSTLPFQMAVSQNLVSDDEKSEVMNLLTFFTVASLMPPRVDRENIILGMARMYELHTTFLNCMEYATSLKTSMRGAASGENQATSSAHA